jgi:hypothetical protein
MGRCASVGEVGDLEGGLNFAGGELGRAGHDGVEGHRDGDVADEVGVDQWRGKVHCGCEGAVKLVR